MCALTVLADGNRRAVNKIRAVNKNFIKRKKKAPVCDSEGLVMWIVVETGPAMVLGPAVVKKECL